MATASDKPTDRYPEHDGASSTSSLERMHTPGLVEARAGGSGREIFGVAAVFNQFSKHLGFGHERITPGFFDESRAAGWPGNGSGVVARYNHSDDFLLGTTRAGTLRLSVDNVGLNYSVDCPQSREDVRELAARGDLQSSFTFKVVRDDWGYSGGVATRTLVSGLLLDVAPVVQPAYVGTSAAVRSLAHAKGIPVEDVKALAAQGELRRLFTRSDIDGGAPAKTMTGEEAYAITMSRRSPRSRLDGVPAETVAAYVRTQGRRYPPTPSQTAALSHAHYKRRLLLTAKRIGW
jgi:phage head maturation protease